MYINTHEILNYIDNQIQEIDELINIYARINDPSLRIPLLNEKKEVHKKYKEFIFKTIHHAQCMMVMKDIGNVSFKH